MVGVHFPLKLQYFTSHPIRLLPAYFSGKKEFFAKIANYLTFSSVHLHH
jgi:hypothetical protein